MAHRFWPHGGDEEHEKLALALADPAVDMVALEKEKIKGAVRTDFILSAEIIVLSLPVVSESAMTTQAALSSSPIVSLWSSTRTRSRMRWRDRRLMRLTLSRNGRTKVVHATDEHRWFVPSGALRQQRREKLTKDLKPGDRLSHSFPVSNPFTTQAPSASSSS